MTSESTMISVKNYEHHHTCQQIVVHVVNQLLAVISTSFGNISTQLHILKLFLPKSRCVIEIYQGGDAYSLIIKRL